MAKGRVAVITSDQFDNAAKALYTSITGNEPESDFVKFENDRWYVLARIVLEGAGLRVP